MDALKNFTSDRWYKMVIAVSVFFLFVSLVVPLQVVPNAAVILMSFGGFVFGIGEWINHPKRASLFNAGGGTIGTATRYSREWHPGGIFLDAAGIALFAWGCYILIATLS